MRVRLRPVERDDALGSDTGLRAAIHAHSGELFGFALRALGDQGLAEEVVQETFVRAWRAGRRFDPDIASLRTWLFAILRNVIVDATRARAVRPGLAETVDVTVADNIDDLLRSWVVEEALHRLSAEHRRAVVEVYYQGRVAALARRVGVGRCLRTANTGKACLPSTS